MCVRVCEMNIHFCACPNLLKQVTVGVDTLPCVSPAHCFHGHPFLQHCERVRGFFRALMVHGVLRILRIIRVIRVIRVMIVCGIITVCSVITFVRVHRYGLTMGREYRGFEVDEGDIVDYLCREGGRDKERGGG